MNSPMTDCNKIRPNLYLFLGGELEDGPRRGTEAHLADCSACRRELELALRSRDVYLSAAAAAVDDAKDIDLWPGIRSRMFSEGLLGAGDPSGAVGPGSARPRFSLLRPWGLAAAAAAAVLLALPYLDGPAQGERDGGGERRRAAESLPTLVDGASVIHRPSVAPNPVAGDPAPVASTEHRLRPVLRGDESLFERELKRVVEEARNGTHTYSLDPSLYDVVNSRRLR
jgi:hypothetical protein